MEQTNFTLPVVSGKTFTRETVIIDGKRFENCRFIECTIIYSGGPSESSSCEFVGPTKWGFQNPAGLVLKVLGAFGWRFEFGEPGPLAPAIPLPIPKV